jgi:alpha-glucosidase
MMVLRWAVAGFVAVGVTVSAQAAQTLVVTSPDGHVALTLSLEAGGLRYEAALDRRTVLEKAPVGICAEGVNAAAVKFGKMRRYRIDDTYPWYGVHSMAHESGEGVEIPLMGSDGAEAFALEARAYDNGIAFRLKLPGGKARIPQETTGFRPVEGSSVWSFDPTRSHYEGVYEKHAAAELAEGSFMAPPVVVEEPEDAAYLAITEGRLQDYPGMVLRADGKGMLSARPGNEVPADKALEYFQGKQTAARLAIPARIAGPIETPWRIVMIARNLNGLVNNDIVSDVADAPDPEIFPEGARTQWIRPGRAVWKYLDDGGPATLENAKGWSRMAGQLGFEYQVLEDYWERWGEAQLKDLVEYSRLQGVGIWLWKNRRDLETEEQRRAFFDMCNRTGVVGVKVDFFDSEAKEVVDLYQAILRDAAEHHLLVNFHGSDKPTGEQRTWPNELTREAVEGMEYCCEDTGSEDAPRAQHAATLPFTRLLAGPADYTPVLFDKGLNGTTWANQIASAVILTSPLLTYAARPETILNNPGVDVIRDIPSVWDETIALDPSRIEELAVFARRNGKRWFLACMNGDTRREIVVPLRFLGGGSWQARTVSDVEGNATAVQAGQARFTAKDSLRLKLGPGGGYVAEFSLAAPQD